MKHVCIQVLNYNSEKNTNGMYLDCISSLVNQSYKNIKITIIDNNSNDNSIIEIKKRFPKIGIITLNKNQATIAFNKGFNEFLNSESDYLLISNNDIIYNTDFIEKSIEFSEKHSDGGFFTPLMIMNDNNKINSTGIIINRSGYAWDRDFGMNENRVKESGEVIAASGGAMFIRREALMKSGSFDPIYKAYYEDVDISLSLRMRSDFKIYYNKQAICKHGFSMSWKRKGIEKEYYMMRNRYIFIVKYFPMRMLINAIRYLFFTSTTGNKKYNFKVYMNLFLILPLLIFKRIKIMCECKRFPADLLQQYQGVPIMENVEKQHI